PKPAKPADEPTSRAPFRARRPLTITMSGVLLVGSGILAVVLLVWVGAHTLGYKDGQAQTLKDKGLASATITDPLRSGPIPMNSGLVVSDPGPTTPQIRPASGSRPASGASEKPVATGEMIAGLNYCLAASRLDKDAADRAAAYLTQNGVPAMAVLEGSGA